MYRIWCGHFVSHIFRIDKINNNDRPIYPRVIVRRFQLQGRIKVLNVQNDGLYIERFLQVPYTYLISYFILINWLRDLSCLLNACHSTSACKFANRYDNCSNNEFEAKLFEYLYKSMVELRSVNDSINRVYFGIKNFHL